jgi:hypothetical protein
VGFDIQVGIHSGAPLGVLLLAQVGRSAALAFRAEGTPSSPENVTAFVQRPFHVHTFLVGLPDAICASGGPRRP